MNTLAKVTFVLLIVTSAGDSDEMPFWGWPALGKSRGGLNILDKFWGT